LLGDRAARFLFRVRRVAIGLLLDTVIACSVVLWDSLPSISKPCDLSEWKRGKPK
jgi:hypothetical protein